MKIIRHVAPDMRQALRSIREQLGEDAVILSSRRIPEGVEVTAAVDFDATSLQGAMNAPAPLPAHAATAAAPRAVAASRAPGGTASAAAPAAALAVPPVQHAALSHPAFAPTQAGYGAPPLASAASPAYAHAAGHAQAPAYAHAPTAPTAYSHAAASHYFPVAPAADVLPFAHILASEPASDPSLAPTSTAAAARQYAAAFAPTSAPPLSAPATAFASASGDEFVPQPGANTPHAASTSHVAPMSFAAAKPAPTDATRARREPTLNIAAPAKQDLAAEALAGLPPAAATGATGDAMGSELKTLRRMLETQLAQLAWNDLTRRAPVHVEILRELTEIGISQELSDYILKQLPDKVELGFARRFAIAGLSQYLLVTGDRWLENGGRVAFIGATGVGKTTTLAKLAVRWVLRHGARDLALVGSDTVRIGAQDQIQSLGQLLGVPVYTPENFESLPTLLSRLGDRHRLILIDTPGSSLRDAQLSSRLGVLSNCASQMETALVLAGSTQAGAIEETVKRFAPANPACCVLAKLDEAASLGGALSSLIRARLPVSYVSEGQRVPEDLRPARALELVSTAVRLAKATGAAADEDLLRRRFGKTAHAIT
jgi:flagellar biosynthesis protein FlhF